MTRNVDKAASSESSEAGAPEIEITEAMMQAGVDAMYAWYDSDGPPEWGVAPIYEAMERARRGLPSPNPQHQNSDKV